LVKEYLDNLKNNGIIDLNHYLEKNPDQLKECVSLIQIVNINKLSQLFYQKTQDTPIIVKTDVLPYLTEESMDTLRRMILSIYNNIPLQKFEISAFRPHKEIKYFLIHVEVIPSDTQNMSRVFSALQDITEQKMLQKELVEKQEIMLKILEELILENYDLKEKMHYFH